MVDLLGRVAQARLSRVARVGNVDLQRAPVDFSNRRKAPDILKRALVHEIPLKD